MTVDVPKYKMVELKNDSCIVEKFCRQLLEEAARSGFGVDDLFEIVEP